MKDSAPLESIVRSASPADLEDLIQSVREVRPDADIERLRKAFSVADLAHQGQVRMSGEPYIIHPLSVAKILADLGMDDDTIIAGLLHDVLEDCEIPGDRLQAEFGDDVLHLVEGVTKLAFKPQDHLNERQRAALETNRTAETLRKMLLAMAKDFRVMVIKLADRLHNMMTIESMPPEKQARIATETLDVYAPLAARLGIWEIKWRLEDLSFQVLHPKEFREINERVASSRAEREGHISTAIELIREKFTERGVEIIDIRGRPKHLYSIFNKMVGQGLQFEQIYDLLALRVIVGTQTDCYVALGIVHGLYMPIPDLFTDYIAKPKPNGYKSLHTKVMGPAGQPLEIQIRTLEMHHIAEHGVAAHWTYKEGKPSLDETKRLQQLREQLTAWTSDHSAGADFLRSISTDLFSEQVFVFTPKGDVIDLPRGSCIVDFAFRVHTQLGLSLVGGKINGRMMPLSTTVENGDVVELVTRKGAQPSLDWLRFVKSSHTRAKLRNHFRRSTREQDAEKGRELLKTEVKNQRLDAKVFLAPEVLAKLAQETEHTDNPDTLLAKIGRGDLSPQAALHRLKTMVGVETLPSADEHTLEHWNAEKNLPPRPAAGSGTSVDASVVANRARCCNPLPGDETAGYVTRGRGIMIHRRTCPNLLAYSRTEPERLVPAELPHDGKPRAVPVRIVCLNRQGLLMDVSTIFAEMKADVSAARIRTLPNHTAELDVTLEVPSREALDQITTRIAAFSDVISILRLFTKPTR